MAGRHELLLLVRNQLILAGYELVEFNDSPDFCIYGGREEPVSPIVVPVLFLSSSKVYSAFDTKLNTLPKALFNENSPLVVPSTMEVNTLEQATFIKNETSILRLAAQVMILRPFNVYGPTCDSVVAQFLEQAAANEPLDVHGNGYQVRAFLHENDFIDCVKKAVKRLLKRGQGIFNVGSTEEITINRLADSVLQLADKDLEVIRTYPPYHVDAWKLADTTRIKAFVRWQPKITIRQGIWRALQNAEHSLV